MSHKIGKGEIRIKINTDKYFEVKRFTCQFLL